MITAKEAYEQHRNGPTNQNMWDYCPYLREISRGNILEIGTEFGVSPAAFLSGVEDHGGHVYSVDINPACAKLYAGHPQWTFIQANSATQVDTIRQSIPESVDVLFIDGDHHYEAVKTDLKNYTPFVRVGGLIVLHDVHPCVQIIEYVLRTGWENQGIYDAWEPRRAFDEFLKSNPTWRSEIRQGLCGLGVIVKGQS